MKTTIDTEVLEQAIEALDSEYIDDIKQWHIRDALAKLRAALAAQQEPVNVEKMREIFEGSPENKKRILFKRGGTVFAESVPEANYVDGSVQHAWVEFQRVYKLGFESTQPPAPVVPQAHERLLEDYENLRIRCLHHANLHPESKDVCHQSIQRIKQYPALMCALALLVDNMAIALSAAPKQE